MNLKKLLDEAGDVLLTRMIRIHPGNSETSIALRSVVKFHFKLGPAYDDKDLYVAAHHWAPLLIKRNYQGSKGNRPSRQFKTLLTRAEAVSYGCSMEETISSFESSMKRAGVSISKMDERRLLSTQAPTNSLSSVRSYFQGLTGDRAVRLRERILDQKNRESLAVSEAVSSASPLRLIRQSAPIVIVSSPELLPSASTLQNYIREHQKKGNDKSFSQHPKFLEAFAMLATFYKNFDAIECATVPKVCLHPCAGVPGSNLCLKYGIRYRQLSTAVFCANCAPRQIKIRRQEIGHQKVKLDDTDGKRTAADSRISFKSLSPGETKVRMANLAYDRKIYRFSTGILREALASSKAKFRFLDCESGFRSLITKAFQTLANLDPEERAVAKQHVIKELVGLSVGEDSHKINEEEASDFAAYLITEITS
jgi:hypothetical protein